VAEKSAKSGVKAASMRLLATEWNAVGSTCHPPIAIIGGWRSKMIRDDGANDGRRRDLGGKRRINGRMVNARVVSNVYFTGVLVYIFICFFVL
jgi:hypothetical protein